MRIALKFAFWVISWMAIAATGIYVPNPVPMEFRAFLTVSGIFFLIYGLTLNAIAGRTLKKYGHFEITKGINKPDRIVTTGIYSCMRHPAQFGSIFFGIGISLITTNIYAIFLASWYAFLAIYFIIAIEERETIANFGEEYCEFLSKTKPFSFSLNCIKKGVEALKNRNAP